LDTLPGLHDFETELLGFPNAAHDDCVDVVSGAVQVVIENPFSSGKAAKTPIAQRDKRGGMWENRGVPQW